MKLHFIITLISLFIISCSPTINTQPIIPDCPHVWSPVCGVNGITYSNSCLAGSTRIAYEGACVKTNSRFNQETLIPLYCKTWYDGCNTCSVQNQKQYNCTNLICNIENEPTCVSYTIPSHCISWYDGCNTCIVLDSKIIGCTKMFCKNYDEAYCLKYE